MQEYTKFKTQLLTDTSMLDEKDKDLLLFASNHEWGTPIFKLRHFVGDAQLTPYAKFRQFIVELRNREEMVEQMEIDVAKNEARIAMEIDKVEASKTENEKRYHQIEVNRLINDNNKFLRRLNVAYSERDRLLTVIKEMYETGEAYLEDGTDMIEIIGTEKEEELESDYWTIRLAKQAACDIIAYGQVGVGNMDSIAMMEPKQQLETLRLAINWSVDVTSSMETITKNALEERKKIDSVEIKQINGVD